MLLVVLTGGACAFALSYRFYGRYLERLFDLAGDEPTPAQSLRDGRDYCPARAPVLFGHHFSSIAGAGPIVGPIFATQVFGWLPAVLWIVFGSIFVGGVHDLGALAVSLQHRARSIADVARSQLSPLAGKLFLVFIWLALAYVLAVFVDLTAATFAPRLPARLPPEIAAQLQHSGGAVAAASAYFIALAIALGVATQRFNVGLLRASLVFVPLLFAAVYLGQNSPWPSWRLFAVNGSSTTGWSLILLSYCFVASIAPVRLLLQPRDYLSSFLLYACLGGGVAGIALAPLLNGPQLSFPAFLGFYSDQLGYLFPALFITIACGACSGFHSVVASGTTAKQLARRRDARIVGYGAMLVEGLLALVAVATMAIVAQGQGTQHPPTVVFADGLGRFLALLGLPLEAGRSFGLLALSTFLLTTLDTGTRLGRYVLEELLRLRGHRALWLSTAATLALPALFSLLTFVDAQGEVVPMWRAVWPVFGTTNQLLGGLALLVVTLWLRSSGRPTWPTAVPTVFMLAATMLSLVQLVLSHGATLLGGIAAALLCLALLLVVEATRSLFVPRPTEG